MRRLLLPTAMQTHEAPVDLPAGTTHAEFVVNEMRSKIYQATSLTASAGIGA